MKSMVAKTFFVIPVIYIGVIFSLVFLQFYAGQSFQESHGRLSLSGRYDMSSEEDAGGISEATVRYMGLEFSFSREQHPTLVGEQETLALRPVGYTTLDSGFELHLERNVSLRFRADADGNEADELMVQAFLPESVRPMNELRLPYRASSDASVESGAGTGELSIAYRDEVYTLTIPPRASIDRSAQTVGLRGDVDFQTIRYRRTGRVQDHIVERRFGEGRNEVSAEELEAELSEYIEIAYQAWSSSRFNGGSGTWEMRAGSPRFEERILTAYLAEAWQRNEYTSAFNQMRRAADQHPDEVGLLSAPFLGNLNEIRSRFLAEDEQKTEELLELISDNDPTVFTERGLFQFARDRGSSELYEELVDFTERVDIHDLSINQAVGLYQLHIEDEYLTPDEQRLLGRFHAIAEERLYPAVVETEEGFFLETAPGQVDVALSALAGHRLERAGVYADDEVMTNLGRQLVRSVLNLADDEGFLPRVVHPGENQLEGSEGSIGPEAIYADLSENPAYPRPASLPATGVFENAWVYTVAEVVDTAITDEQARVRIRYPRNQTFYVIMQNVPPFERMELFGQTWRNDRAFENYIKGRNYVGQSETLLIKYTDDSVERDITLFY